MEISNKQFDKIASLARLSFTEDERESMKRDMEKIISWVKKLEELDTDGVEPLTHMSHEINVFRADENHQHLAKSKLLENAPHTQNGFVEVPKVID